MNEYISNLQEETNKVINNSETNAKKKNQEEIKKIILIRLGLDENILNNPRAFKKISSQMSNHLYSLGRKTSINESIDIKEVEDIVRFLKKCGWKNVYKIGFVVPANTNKFNHGVKRVKKKGKIKQYKKETRYHISSKSKKYIDIDDLTILRIEPNSENETIIVGNTRTSVDNRGVEVLKIDSRAEYNHKNAFNLNDFLNPTEETIMNPIKQMASEGDMPIKSYNGFLKGICLIFNRYLGENEGAGKLKIHVAKEASKEDEKSRFHSDTKSIDLTRMEGDIARLDEISLRNIKELEDYEFDPNNKKANLQRIERLKLKREESNILRSLYNEQR